MTRSGLSDIMYTCLILHNMIIHDNGNAISPEFFPEEQHRDDDPSVIAISCNPVQHSRTKHIAVCYHLIKEHVENGTIELYFVKTDYQLADNFNKALPVERFNYLVGRVGMRSLSPQELERLAKS
ncbi:hypothetical protein Tco_0819088 [Tanacetum coccineum]|uniref:Retrovirus-related Pol polyprotein from transposon TNT 1-94 n=1 Tax=Tanacetum coccineum TaxID=301880 RepID=A0ABQ5A7B7_9ASTR